MSDTPETDAIAHAGLGESAYISQMTDKARSLERERNEARAALREAIQFRDTTMNGYDLDAWIKAAGLKEGAK